MSNKSSNKGINRAILSDQSKSDIEESNLYGESTVTDAKPVAGSTYW